MKKPRAKSQVPPRTLRRMHQLAALADGTIARRMPPDQLTTGQRALLEVGAQATCELIPAYFGEVAALTGHPRAQEYVAADWQYVRDAHKGIEQQAGPEAALHFVRALMTIGAMTEYTLGQLLPEFETLKRAHARRLSALKKPDERKAEAQRTAVEHAELLWKRDKRRELRTGDVTKRVRRYLHSLGLTDAAPKTDKGLLRWIAHTIPDYARQPGRPKRNPA